MSDAFLSLQRQAESVGRLIRDLYAADTPTAGWETPVVCAETLGNDAPVDRWYLAEYFLTTWTAWHSLLSRYLQYFGVARESVPCQWLEVKAKGAAIATRFREDSRLGEWIADAWRAQCRSSPEELDAPELYREIVASHERLMWVPEFASDLEAWQGCLGAAREVDGQVRKGFERSSRQSRRQVLWHLRQYRHATLDVSWLDERRWKARPSAFEFALGASDRTPAGLESLRQVPLADAATAKVAETMLRRVARAISELGYEAFFGDVCADEMLGGPFSPIGASAVDLLTPNRHVSATAQSNVIILGVAKGHKQGQKGGWPAILETVVRRLEANTTAPAGAVVISEGDTAAPYRGPAPAI